MSFTCVTPLCRLYPLSIATAQSEARHAARLSVVGYDVVPLSWDAGHERPAQAAIRPLRTSTVGLCDFTHSTDGGPRAAVGRCPSSTAMFRRQTWPARTR